MTLEAVFAEVLGMPIDEVGDTLALGESRYWDSMKHLELVTALEQHYKIILSTRDIYGLKTFSQARELLKKKGVSL